MNSPPAQRGLKRSTGTIISRTPARVTDYRRLRADNPTNPISTPKTLKSIAPPPPPPAFEEALAVLPGCVGVGGGGAAVI